MGRKQGREERSLNRGMLTVRSLLVCQIQLCGHQNVISCIESLLENLSTVSLGHQSGFPWACMYPELDRKHCNHERWVDNLKRIIFSSHRIKISQVRHWSLWSFFQSTKNGSLHVKSPIQAYSFPQFTNWPVYSSLFISVRSLDFSAI